MTTKIGFDTKIGILDPEGKNLNPLNNKNYSDTYLKLAKIWSTYPAYEKGQEILDTIDKNQLSIVISATGSGKTVLIPKFVLHYFNYNGLIAITLPKRSVTLSAATFSAKTLDVELGTDVGYVYKRSDKKMLSPKNKLIYMTDGTLIMEFIKDPLLSKYTAIIIDEAHERSIRIDLLMLFIRNIISSGRRPDLKIIIMSATIDPAKYYHYFKNIKPALIRISGQTMYDIEVNFLTEPSSAYLNNGLDIIDKLISSKINGSILFFITTSKEAFDLCQKIRSNHPKVYCIEVYADMDRNLKIYAETRDAFLELGDYEQKLIMATNVAESSITIDGLKYVIDSGYELYNYFDVDSDANILEKRLITKAQAMQRRGRVGRTETGVCYHLMTKTEFESLRDFPEPEILKQDISMDMLKIIILTPEKTFQAGYNMLQQLMDVPKNAYIDYSRNLFKLYNIIDDSDNITKIGYYVSNFPSISINRSLFLIYAFDLHVAREASIILAMLEKTGGKVSNIFIKADTICESDCEKPASSMLIKKLSNRHGDHLTYIDIFKKYDEQKDKDAWLYKYGIRRDVMSWVDRESKTIYYKMMDIRKKNNLDSNMARIEMTKKDIEKRLIDALKKSHLHRIAKKLTTTYPKNKIEAKIGRNSVVHGFYDKKQLEKKIFIYDELVSINSNWEFSTVTIIG